MLFEGMHIQETNSNQIKLCHMMLKCLVEGGSTHEQANADHAWLTPGEEKIVVEFCTKGDPYQQRAGTRENITGIVTICADGTTIRPAVIFKGNAYNVRWGDNNPLKALYEFCFFFDQKILIIQIFPF
ncbi:hypothetical protein CVT25_000809 [Psilocybe cyanescens]|uniref:Uncharacterized protein n=1 Tax=Psilocybe cyanescens TaxID=93625 RepID=A0A409XXS9_PSICY|nr:hypothetical protein CVT25_000809 [Psilocybe cyanescens]